MKKCSCGYECRISGEVQMLEKYNCARALEKKEGPFASVSVICCSIEERQRQEGPELPPIDDGTQFKEAYLKRFEKDKKEDPRKF